VEDITVTVVVTNNEGEEISVESEMEKVVDVSWAVIWVVEGKETMATD
jgi:hypothetical protein